MKPIDGGVTAAAGFSAAATAAKIKYEGRDDLALIVSDTPCRAAGTFTSNVVKAAPVIWDRDLIKDSPFVQAVVVNSGIANACTGQEGLDICRETAGAAAEALSLPADSVLIASTGVIGMQIPMDRIKAGISAMVPELSHDISSGTKASMAIMTTDTKNKEAAVQFEAGGKTVTLGGMSKGSGMIHPNMCTMLAFLTTDLAISKELLQEALSEDVKDTFNMISVDGDTSTNDTLIIMANGNAGNPEITEKNDDYKAFCEALHYVNETLARMMAGDGEGAHALFTVTVKGAASKEQARTLARSVVSSTLTKAAIFGHDANWGRILCAMGYSGADFDPYRVDLYIESAAGKLKIVENGMATDYSEEEASKILSEPEVTVVADIKEGTESATAWGCDLTYDYITINADYRS